MNWWTKAVNRFKPDFQITEHFRYSEFACHDGTPYPREWLDRLEALCLVLEQLRLITGSRIQINSGYRTPEYNKKIGGARLSQHVEGRAADITGKFQSVHYFNIANEMRKNGIFAGGLGYYHTFIHIDIRGSNATWGRDKVKEIG